jgi:SAM-dependent methyltransferase
MHPSSLINMRLARTKYLESLSVGLTILDVGGRGIDSDRSYRSIFADLDPVYHIADIVNGDGVTHIMPSPYTLPFNDNSIDLIVSGQTLEHVRNPFRSIAEMKRVLKPNCYMVIIAPSSGPRHDVIDCWRFMDDAFKSIADETELTVVADWIDRSAPDDRSRKWADHVFVGRK